ncbi:hypothetical protein Hdeb2414_s0016g00483411 [Helianthus debilis subsp. tardiflorus]|nr:hypothetical protein HanHA89_Chr10g0400081 [Helianthus annuus]
MWIPSVRHAPWAKFQMTGGSFAPAGVAKDKTEQYEGKITTYVSHHCLNCCCCWWIHFWL